VVANSERTQREVVEQLGVPADRVRVVYLTADGEKFRPASADEKAAVRRSLGWHPTRPYVAFVGSPANPRKNFQTALACWGLLARDPGWDADLVVLGDGRGMNAPAVGDGGRPRVHLLGLRSGVAQVLRACDALVAPVRYEAYGLAVHEALCCGLPAFVSQGAGVAERYPADLRGLLLPDPGDAEELAARLRLCCADLAGWRRRVAPLAESLRARTWDQVAGEIVDLVEATPPATAPLPSLAQSAG
jgi:glycosyltransferase involved in cell wall biosynthesis